MTGELSPELMTLIVAREQNDYDHNYENCLDDSGHVVAIVNVTGKCKYCGQGICEHDAALYAT